MSVVRLPVPGLGAGGLAKATIVAALRRRIRSIERQGSASGAGGAGLPLPLGLPAVDEALPGGGLGGAALHEVQGEAAAIGFIAALAAGRLRQGVAGPVFWCLSGTGAGWGAGPGLYPPGLAAFGLGADRLILLRAQNQQQTLWAMEEALVSGQPAVVVGEAWKLDLTASRRLQLAAETGGVIGFLRAPGRRGRAAGGHASAAMTRWSLESAPSFQGVDDLMSARRARKNLGGEVGRVRFAAELLRGRGARPRAWFIEWDDATHSFAMATALGDGSPRRQPPAARLERA